MTSILNTIRGIIVEDNNIDLDAWNDPAHQVTDDASRKSFQMTPLVLGTLVNSPGLLALLATALKPHLETTTEE